jgi:hypothetical protein
MKDPDARQDPDVTQDADAAQDSDVVRDTGSSTIVAGPEARKRVQDDDAEKSGATQHTEPPGPVKEEDIPEEGDS